MILIIFYNINIKYNFIFLFYRPVLNIAIEKGNTEIVKLLLSCVQIDPNIQYILIYIL